MEAVKLGQRQLFAMGEKSLSKRLGQFYQRTGNTAEVVEFAVAILIRHTLCLADFSNCCKTLLREIFLTSKPNNTLRQYCVLFQDYFEAEEWQQVLDRLFQNRKEYKKFTKETCLYKKLLDKKNQEVPEPSEYQFNIVSVFKDAAGKKHTWTLRDAKQVRSEVETSEVLKMLSSLTIFQVAGVRRFTEYVKFKSHKTYLDAEHEMTQEEQESSAQNGSADKTDVLNADYEPSSQQPKSASTVGSGKKTAEKKDAKPLLSEEPLSNGLKSPVAKTASSAEKNKGSSQVGTKTQAAKLDNPYGHDRKSMERIKKGREAKRLKRVVDRQLGKKKNRK